MCNRTSLYIDLFLFRSTKFNKHVTGAFIWTSAAAIIIFRFELSFLLGLLLLSDLLYERACLTDVLKRGLFTGGVCLGEWRWQ